MILACVCGRRFRIPGDSEPKRRTCPQCGGVLQPEGEALAPAIERALSDPRREEKGTRARELAEPYTYEHRAQRIATILEELAAELP